MSDEKDELFKMIFSREPARGWGRRATDELRDQYADHDRDLDLYEKLAKRYLALEAENLALHEATRWRDPRLEPPEALARVCFVVNRRVYTGYMSQAGWWHVYAVGNQPGHWVSHWMPLPEPPEKK